MAARTRRFFLTASVLACLGLTGPQAALAQGPGVERLREEVVEPRNPEQPLLDLAVEVSSLTRNLSFQGGPPGGPGPYQLDFGPTLGGTLELYPGASAGDAALAGLGVRFEADASVGLDSANGQGTHYPTSANAWEAALTYRWLLGAVVLTPSLGAGRESFSISLYPGQQSRPSVPSVAYRRVRPALAARILLGKTLHLRLQAAYLLVLSEGQLGSGDYFPGATASGLEARAGIAWAVGPTWELRLEGYFRRYAMELHPAAGVSSPTAAVDQFAGVSLGFAYRGL